MHSHLHALHSPTAVMDDKGNCSKGHCGSARRVWSGMLQGHAIRYQISWLIRRSQNQAKAPRSDLCWNPSNSIARVLRASKHGWAQSGGSLSACSCRCPLSPSAWFSTAASKHLANAQADVFCTNQQSVPKVHPVCVLLSAQSSPAAKRPIGITWGEKSALLQELLWP